MVTQIITRVPWINVRIESTSLLRFSCNQKQIKKKPCVRVVFNGYTEKRLLGNNNDVLRGGGDGVNHSKKLYSEGLYRTF